MSGPFDFPDPMAATVALVTMFQKKQEADAASAASAQATQRSTSADRAAEVAIFQALLSSATSSATASADAQKAQKAIDLANAASDGVDPKTRLAQAKASLQSALGSQVAAAGNLAVALGYRVQAAKAVSDAIEAGIPIAMPAMVPASAAAGTTAPAPKALSPEEYVESLRQRAAAAKAAADAQAERSRAMVSSIKRTNVHGEHMMTTSGYSILGARREILGEGDFDLAKIIPDMASATGQGISKILQWDSSKKASAKAKSDAETALRDVLKADQLAKEAVAKAAVSEATKAQSAAADKMAAQLALQAEDEAAASLQATCAPAEEMDFNRRAENQKRLAEYQKKRTEAAGRALASATSEWQAATDENTSKIKAIWVEAAKMIYMKTQNALLVQASQMPGGLPQQAAVQRDQTGSWLTRRVVGPLPGWVLLAGGIAAVIAAVLFGASRLVRR